MISSQRTMTSIDYTTASLSEMYYYFMSIADKRVENWLLMSSPWPTLLLTLGYFMIIWLGPKFMDGKPAFQLKCLMPAYNIAISLLNLYIGIELGVRAYKLGYSWLCQPVNTSDDPDELAVAAGLWWYYFSKCLEFVDTVIFILRKKFNQLTFLHVYHHSTMFCLWWIGVKWVPGGSPLIAAMLNSFVHVLMYTYYGISSFGPRFTRFLWWKKYLTIIQMAQFLLALVLGIRAIIFGCDFPMWMQYTLVLYMLSFIVLFGNFYYHAYNDKHKKLKKLKESSNGCHDLRNGYIDASSSEKQIKRRRKSSHTKFG